MHSLLPPDIPQGETPALFEQIAQKLESQGYAVLPASLPETITDALMQALAIQDEYNFRAASVGRGPEQTKNPFIRRDRILWIEPHLPAVNTWLEWTEQLRCFLNQRLFMGLFSFESHFAYYQPGDFYKKHFDAFRGQSNRVLSVVTYLNRGWEPGQGGELIIYAEDNHSELIKVQPAFGTLVLFLSEHFPHEVLPACRERYSIAGWYRINSTRLDHIDPPA
ncbi:2OG-Fe(II) oxygenase [Pontibacter sp. JAM-7]|uniref:2OG-Fe(II) oxygenase n=1 Tax=Pontibacter sp. JAM-7 TaxID=3366581 RepID=UPI003AF5DD89